MFNKLKGNLLLCSTIFTIFHSLCLGNILNIFVITLLYFYSTSFQWYDVLFSVQAQCSQITAGFLMLERALHCGSFCTVKT